MKRLLTKPIEFYRHHISPYKGVSCCRFIPTCSEYALQAIETHGAVKGSYLAVRRLSKCHPFHKGGYDPVPVKKEKNDGEEKITDV